MHGTATQRSTATPAHALRRSIRLAHWALLAFTGGTVLSVMLPRHLLESEQGGRVQRFVDLNVGELFGAAAVASLISRRAQHGRRLPEPTSPCCLPVP